MTPDLTLVPATHADRDALLALKHQMNISEFNWRTLANERGASDYDLSPEAAAGPVDRDLTALKSGIGGIILAVLAGKAVGYVSFTVKENSTSFQESARSYLYVAGLAVDELHRNSGIGAVLLEAVDREAKMRGLNKVMLDVSVISPASRFYKRAGFTTLSQSMIKRLD